MNRIPSLIVVLILCHVVAVRASVPAISLSQLEDRIKAAGDTTLVINFWATWCKPCVAELPHFDKVSRTMQADGAKVKIILVSLDSPKDLGNKVEPFVVRRGLHPDVVLLNEAKAHLWIDRVDPSWSGAIPATLIVNHAAGKRAFHEREFTYKELQQTIQSFQKELR